MYKLLDKKTGKHLPKVYKTRATAERAVNRLNNDYGGYRYVKTNLDTGFTI